MKTHRWLPFTLAVGLAASLSPLQAIPTRAPQVPSQSGPESVPSEAAGRWARGMLVVAEEVARKHALPVTPAQLLAGAIKGLFQTAGVRLPDRYQGDLAAYLDRQPDPGIELIRARFGAGNPEPIRGELAVRAGLEGMLTALDPHSLYLSAEELGQNFYDENLGQAGIAFEEREGAGPLVVRSVLLDSAAHRAGILPGDAILSIAGKSTENLNASQGRSRLQGRPGAKVAISWRPFRAENARDLELELATVREEETVFGHRRLPDKGWNCYLDGKRGIAYLRVTTIRSGGYRLSPGELVTHEMIASLLNQLHGRGMRALILDLRDSPSGYLREMDEIISMFLREGTLRITLDRMGEKNVQQGGGGRYVDFPMAVLIGPETSGAGEQIAAALHDNGRAKLVGQRTRGKGSIQEILDRNNSTLGDWPFPGTGYASPPVSF